MEDIRWVDEKDGLLAWNLDLLEEGIEENELPHFREE
jgi:hypothetical protein